MRTNFLRACALVLGLTASGPALAQYGHSGYQYGQPSAVPTHPSLQQLPVGYTPFHHAAASAAQQEAMQAAAAHAAGAFASGSASAGVPARMVSGQTPLPSPDTPSLPVPPPPPGDANVSGGAGLDPNCSSCNQGPIGSGFLNAASSPWENASDCAPVSYGPVPMSNWFGRSGVVFWQRANDCGRRLVFDDAAPATTRLSSSQVGQDDAAAFEISAGRYFGCGRYFGSFTYWNLDPNRETATVVAPMAGDYRSTMRNWDRIDYDHDGNAATAAITAFAHFDDATAYRVRRDSDFHNLEFNFGGFALAGAARGAIGELASECEPCGLGAKGCTGPCGMLVPATCGRMRLQWTAGVRWFRFEDMFQFASSTTANGYGTGLDDLYYDVNVKNDLVGFQLGGRADFCVGKCVNLYIGSKAGVYGNDAEFRSRLGSSATLTTVGAYYPTMAGQNVLVEEDDTSLATLAEVDLGVGYRLTPCIGIYGGYRVLGAAGVATADGTIADDLANVNDTSYFCADESLLLHGAYVGSEYNF